MVEPRRDLAWDDLRLVRAVAEGGGLAAAAARLGVNASTVFRRLASLEAGLGLALFERHRSGYLPTSAGAEIAAVAGRMEDEVAGLALKLAGRAVLPAGELRVTTNDSLLVHLLTPLFARFRRAYPLVRLDVVLANQALNLSRRDADVAIRATDRPPETLVGRRVARIGWALYGRAEDFPAPEAVEGHRAIDFCRDHDWVALGDSMAALKAVRFVEANVSTERIAYRVNSVLGLAEAIEAGLGIGHLPCFIADARPGLRRLAAPEQELGTDLWLLTHPDLRQLPRVRAFLDVLAEEITARRRFIEGGGGG